MRALIFGLAALAACAGAPASNAADPGPTPVCAACVKANMERLAGDELRGRKCGSADEAAAADFIIAQLRAAKVAGAFAGGGYIQSVPLLTPTYAAPPVLEISAGGAPTRLVNGQDMVLTDPPPALEAPMLRVKDPRAAGAAAVGKLVVYDSGEYDAGGIAMLAAAGAIGVVSPANPRILAAWDQIAARPPGPTEVGGAPPPSPVRTTMVVLVKPDVMEALRALDGGVARLDARRGPDLLRTTHNVMGVIQGGDADADRHAVLLSAHYDHLGVRGGVIYHGADDDASGTAAVLEFARILGSGARPNRTVYFGLFGCEEEGELGAEYFRTHAPMALSDLSANLEFEMIGVVDPNRPGVLMMTGWERSNLGPALKAHGAQVGPDPYPKEDFFRRSDNYQLAQKGVVAQTVSAWPLTPTYHSPTDDLAHVDMAFMDEVIGSLVGPVAWLVNSDFQPAWNPGMQP
ncbi:MAG: M28 family peptidase [Phenylobacterium sp.]|nr:MAG: M28 family peptidase [Phenylobacterium sp.]